MKLTPRKAISVFGAFLVLAATSALAAPGCGGSTVVQPGTPDWQSCSGPGQCTLDFKGCCGTCGAPTVADMDGVNREKLTDHRNAVCPTPEACPKCASILEPNLAAFCEESACKALDVRTHAVSECVTDADCRLRYAGCCEGCGGGADGLIALNAASAPSYMQQVCAPDEACPACAPIYPAGVAAVCNASKHCEVTQ